MHPDVVRERHVVEAAWRAPDADVGIRRGESPRRRSVAPSLSSMPIPPTSHVVPPVAPSRTASRPPASRVTERYHRIPTVVEPAPRAPERLVEAEPDYRPPSPRERGRLLLAAYESTSTDASQRLLIAEIMAQYRAHCLRRGMGDPFCDEVPARVVRGNP